MMLKFALIIPALVLAALGAEDLYNADRESPSDFVMAGVELVTAIALIGLAFVLGRRTPPDTEPAAAESSERAEVLERLQRHTEGLRLAAERQDAAAPDAGADQDGHASSGADDYREPSARIEAPRDAGGDAVHQAPQPADVPLAPAAGEPSSPPDAAAAAAEAGAVRLPPLMLLNMTSGASPGDIESAPPLGSRADVLARLREVVPDLDIDERGRTEHTGPDHAIRLDLGAHDSVHTIVIEAGGRTGISLVRWLLESTGWRAFAPKLGRFVDPDDLDGVAVRD